MYTIYVYVLDTLADWEIGYVTAELHSGRFFKKDAPRLSQNSQRFKIANPYNGRADHHARLLD